MKYLAIIGALIVATPALADPPIIVPPGQNGGPEQQQQQQQGQAQGQIQGQGQLQGQAQKSVNKNKNTAVGVGIGVAKSKSYSNSGGNDISIRGDDVDPPAYAPSVSLTSSGCIGSWSANGGGWGIVSMGGGATEEHRRCTKMEAARILISLGDKASAMKLIKSIDWVQAVLNPKEEGESAKRPSNPAPIASAQRDRQVAQAWVNPDGQDKPWILPDNE
jgi:hypothetical protein